MLHARTIEESRPEKYGSFCNSRAKTKTATEPTAMACQTGDETYNFQGLPAAWMVPEDKYIVVYPKA